MFDGSTMQGIRKAVAAYAARFDPALVSALDAHKVVADAAAVENMAATIKALAAKRVADTDLWKAEGDLTAAHQLARQSGTSVTKAKEALETAARLGELPELDAATRRGEVSPSQAAPIADAATKNPKAESRLIKKAKGSSLGELIDECARTKAAAEPDPDARHRAIHRSRFLRKRRTADGAGELTYRSTLEEVTEIFAVVQGMAQRVFEKARAEGRREPEEAYLADGLLAAARAAAAAAKAGAASRGRGAAAANTSPGGAGAGDATPENTAAPGGAGAEPQTPTAPGAAGAKPESGDPTGASAAPGSTDDSLAPPVQPSKIVVRIDWDSLVRGFPIDDEVCDIAGVGPVPVSTVEAMIASGDAFLAAVVTKGLDVVNVAHLGRRPNAYQRSALEWMNPTCMVRGCNASMRLQIDHRQDWAHTKITLLELLDGLCMHHHALKTYKHWGLVAGKGKRLMVPPWDRRHPKHARAGPAPPGEAEVA